MKHRIKSAKAIMVLAIIAVGQLSGLSEVNGAVKGSVKFYGATEVRKQLLEHTLSDAFKAYFPEVELKAERTFNNFFHKACELIMKEEGDFLLTSRLDWEHRANEKERGNLAYAPAAKLRVNRGGEEVGGVEYGVVFRNDKLSSPERAFVSFLGSAKAQEALEKDNPYGYVPLDAELKEFTPPEYWRKEPWKDRPIMVHGMDLHPMEYGSTKIAELQRMRMQGFNSALARAEEATLKWAYNNSMMISGLPRAESREERARLAAEYPNCWGTFLQNEDTVSHWMTKMYRGFDEGDEKKHPERVKAFRQVKNGGFADWAKEKHGSLDKLNERWNTSYESWDEIGLPNPRLEEIVDIYEGIVGPEQVGYQWRQRFGPRGVRYTIAEYPDLLDLRRYCRQVWAKWYDDRIDEIRPIIGEDFCYSTKAKPEPYNHRASEKFNCASHDHGPCKYHPLDQQVLVDTTKIPLGWGVWNSEDHLYNHGHSTPRRVRNAIFNKYLMGQFKDTTYCWHTGGTRPAASSRHNIAVRTRNAIRKHEDVFRAFMKARADADLGVLVTEGNRAWDEYEPLPEERDYGAVAKAFAHMATLGRPWKYVMDRDVSEEHVGKVLIIDAPWLTDETVEKLVELPENRRLVAVGEIPQENEYGERFDKDIRQKLKERTTVVEDWDAISEEVEPADGMVSPYNKVDKAKFWTWNRFREREPWYSYALVARLEARRVKHEGKLYVAVVNHADREITAPIPWGKGKEVRNLMGKDPEKKVDPDSYHYTKQAIALFEIR